MPEPNKDEQVAVTPTGEQPPAEPKPTEQPAAETVEKKGAEPGEGAKPDEQPGEKPAEEPKPGETKADRDWRKLREQRRELRRQNEELQQRLAALEAKSGEKPAEKPPEKPAEEPEPKLEDFQDQPDPFAAFTKAMGAYGARQEFRKLQAEQPKPAEKKPETPAPSDDQKKAAEAAKAAWEARVGEFKKERPDYDDLVEDVADIVVPPFVQIQILDSDTGPALVAKLAENPDELKRICSLTPGKAAAAIVRMDDALKAERAEKSKPQPQPKPPTVVKPAGSAPKGPESASSFTEYKQLRQAQERRA